MTSETAAGPDGETPFVLPPVLQFVGSFDELPIPDLIRVGLKDLGYTGPTKVQRDVFAPVRGGKDVLVQSRTGSGKTTAFCLPILCGVDVSERAPQALILAPTRELALQVSAEAARIGHHAGIRVATIYGGASMRAQIDALQSGVHVVVGTPGRVKDLFRQGHLRFSQIRFAVLDEADEMLNRGFWDEVTSILDQLPEKRQTCLFSATLPEQIERAARRYLVEPERVNLSGDNLNVTTIRHVIHHEKETWSKPRNFLYVLEFHKPSSAIVFCNRKDETEMICSYLKRFGFRAEALNGDMPQRARERTLEKVKAGQLDLMVATDIAARGIDISDLGHVFNYDLPEHDEVYVHRVGRTGRIGKSGVAASLVRGKYLAHLANLRKMYKVPFEEIELPNEKEILWMQAERLATTILEDASGVEVEQYRAVAESMLTRGDVKEILAFLLRTHYSQERRPEGPGSADDRGANDRPRSEHPERERGPRPERADRGERRPRERERRPALAEAAGGGQPAGEGPQDDAPSTIRNLYVSLGRDDGVADLTALAQRLGELAGVDVLAHFAGQGDVRDHSSHIEVDAEVAERVIAGVHGKPRGGAPAPVAEGEAAAEPRTIVCEVARPRERRSHGGGPGGGHSRGPRRPRRP